MSFSCRPHCISCWGTRLVYACFPYFFTTMVALLCGEEYDKATAARSRVVWGAALTLAVVASLLLATATIALLGAMVAIVGATALTDRRLARTRLLKFVPVVLIGITVQGIWMHRNQRLWNGPSLATPRPICSRSR